MARSPHRRWLAWLAVLATASIVAWRLTDGAPAPQSRAMPERTEGAVDAGTSAAPSTPRAPSSSSAPAPPVAAPAPPGCADDEPEDQTLVRPSITDALRLRIDELRDRAPQLARDGSEALREGLNGMAGPDEEGAMRALTGAPDRVRDGFDVTVAALLYTGMRALARDDLRTAERRAQAAVREAPDDPLPHVLASVVSARARDTAGARDEIDRAYALAPDEPAFALEAARADAEAAYFDRALIELDAYLRAVPDDTRARRWRERLALAAESTRDVERRRLADIEIAFPRSLPTARADDVLSLIRDTLDEVARLTGHERRPELAVVVHPDRESMRRATCTPSWTGAVFDGVLHLDAQTLTREGAGWERVVRHESTHAQLARVEGRVPHWLNEGVAQWMEGPPSESARRTWQRMVRDRFWIPFESLEGGLTVIDDPNDAGLAYHQSLAMVRYLVHRNGPRVIRDAVAQIEAGHHEGLFDALAVDARGERLLEFLAEDAPRLRAP